MLFAKLSPPAGVARPHLAVRPALRVGSAVQQASPFRLFHRRNDACLVRFRPELSPDGTSEGISIPIECQQVRWRTLDAQRDTLLLNAPVSHTATTAHSPLASLPLAAAGIQSRVGAQEQ